MRAEEVRVFLPYFFSASGYLHLQQGNPTFTPPAIPGLTPTPTIAFLGFDVITASLEPSIFSVSSLNLGWPELDSDTYQDPDNILI